MTTHQTRTQIQARLNDVFWEVFEDETIVIHDAMTAKDLDEWDSLMHITLVVAVEKEFNVRLSAREVGALQNVGEMLDLIERKTA